MIDRVFQARAALNEALRRLDVIRAAIGGTLDRVRYVRYLAGIAQQYAPHSPRVMCLAAARCLDTHPELGRYLLRHAADESGHGRWAFDDLLALGVPEGEVRAAQPVPACAAMIGYTYYLAAQANPVALYGWMFVLEAVGADLGPDAGAGLRTQFPGALRFVAGHAAADQGHTRELEDHIRKHVCEPGDAADVALAAEVSADLYLRMFEQLGS